MRTEGRRRGAASPGERRSHAWRWFAYALLAVPVALILVSFPRWTVDDAFITYRYAQNLADHGQLTWNPGEDPVEGYTGVTMPLLVAGGMALGARPETIGHGIGVLSLLLCIAGVIVFLDGLRLHPVQVLVFGTLIAAAPFLYTHAFSGLETMLFAVVVLGCFLQLHGILDRDAEGARPHRRLALLLLLAVLTRPEGAALVLVAIPFLLGRLREQRAVRRALPAYFTFLLVPAGLYLGWRWSYYGYPLPNTYYAKHASGFSISTIRSAYHFARDYLLLPLCAAATLTLIARPWTRRTGLPMRTVSILFLFGAVVLAQYAISDLTMNYSYRFFAPFFPVTIAMLGATTGSPADRARGSDRGALRGSNYLLAALALFWGLQVTLDGRWLVQKERVYARSYARLLSSEHIPAAQFLRQAVPAREWLVVYYDAGVVPFLSELKSIDFGGLNDAYLAHHPALRVDDRVDYFFSRNPGAIVFTSFDPDQPDRGPLTGRAVAMRVRSDPRFSDYLLVRRYGCPDWPAYFLLVYLRKDLASGPVANQPSMSPPDAAIDQDR